MMMVVPRTKLLIWIAVLLPLAAAGGMFARATPVAAAAFSVLALLALVDALRGRQRLDGLQVSIVPEVVRVSKDHPGELGLVIENRATGRHDRLLRLGLPFPPDMQVDQESLLVSLPRDSQFSRATWPVTGRERGRHFLDRCYLETRSPLGLWDARKQQPVHAEIRVYPNLFEERKKLAALFLNRPAVGVHSQRLVGQGREFEKLREYVPGDSYDSLHWKATARRGKPITKVYQIERTQEVYVLVDSSRLTARAVLGMPLLEHFLKSSLILGLTAQRQGDLFGIVSFNERIESFLRAASGKSHYNACRDAIYQLQPHLVSPDFEELFSFVRLRLRRRALLVVLTDLSDPILAEGFAKSVELVARQHLVLAAMVRPSGARPVFTGAPASQVDDLYDRLTGHLVWQNLREVQNELHRIGIRLSFLDDASMSAQLVSEYLSVKQRQVL